MAATPTLASISQLDARTPGGVSDADVSRALAALEDASAWIRTEAGTEDWLDAAGLLETVPGVIVSICCAVARRILDNPAGLASESIAGYSYTQANPTSDVYLTKAEKAMIHKAVGGGGLVSVPLEGPYTPPWPDPDFVYGRRGYDAYPDWYTAQ